MRRLFPALVISLIPFTASADDLPMADNPPPLRDAGRYITNIETAIFNGPLDQVVAALQQEDTGVLAYVEPTDRIPAVLGTTPIEGVFPDEVGATRRVNLDGGYYAVERVLINDEDTFAYQVWNFTAPSTGALSHIRGEFQYNDLGDGRTEVVWTYSIAPRFFLARPFIRSFIENDFAPFMEAGLQGAANAFNESLTN